MYKMTRQLCARSHGAMIAGKCPWCGKPIWKEPRAKPELTLTRFRRMIQDIRDADMLVTSTDGSQAREAVCHFCAIIDSMTPLERRYPTILDECRIQRIAQGSGTSEDEVHQLLTQFAGDGRDAQNHLASHGLIPHWSVPP